MTATEYRKKPVTITASQWDGTVEGATAIIQWVLDNGGTARYIGVGEDHYLRRSDDGSNPAEEPFNGVAFLVIHTLEGIMRADAGYWIIRGVKGEFYPCKPDIFAATYEEPSVVAEYVDIVFDAPPGPESGRFVEVESPAGRSIRFGEWIDRGDGYWALRFVKSAI